MRWLLKNPRAPPVSSLQTHRTYYGRRGNSALVVFLEAFTGQGLSRSAPPLVNRASRAPCCFIERRKSAKLMSYPRHAKMSLSCDQKRGIFMSYVTFSVDKDQAILEQKQKRLFGPCSAQEGVWICRTPTICRKWAWCYPYPGPSLRSPEQTCTVLRGFQGCNDGG